MSSLVLNMVGAGGGGVSLNYTVIGGTTQPANPSENMIWINTETTVGDVSFRLDAPDSPLNGDVWFTTGTSPATPVALNVLDGTDIIIYPQAVYQYQTDSWVICTAQIYQNSVWVDFITPLYWEGNIEGYSWGAKSGAWRGANSGSPTITNASNYIRANISNGNISFGFASTKIDITNVKTFYMDINVSSFRGNESGLCDGLAAWRTSPTSVGATTNFASANNGARHVYELDVSDLEGEYFLGYRGSTTNSSTFKADMYKAWVDYK